MSTDLKLEIATTSSEDTIVLGHKIGQVLNGGELILLSSDLGGGKTTLTRGIASGAGSKDNVSSPTFTISKLYKGPKFYIYHYDFYRLSDPGLIKFELAETIDTPKNVIIIEWGDIVNNSLPDSKIAINIFNKGEDSRTFEITVPAKLSYIYEAIK